MQIPEEMIHYGMTKTAQIAIARGLAESLAGTGITVNSVLPGPTRPRGVGDFVEALAKEQGKSFAEFEREFFSRKCAPPPSSSASLLPKKWPTWWRTYAVRWLPRLHGCGIARRWRRDQERLLTRQHADEFFDSPSIVSYRGCCTRLLFGRTGAG